MISTKSSKYGRYVQGTITIKLTGHLKKGDEREFISEKEALTLLEFDKEGLSGSNDGSEAIANAKIIITP